MFAKTQKKSSKKLFDSSFALLAVKVLWKKNSAFEIAKSFVICGQNCAAQPFSCVHFCIVFVQLPLVNV